MDSFAKDKSNCLKEYRSVSIRRFQKRKKKRIDLIRLEKSKNYRWMYKKNGMYNKIEIMGTENSTLLLQE